MEIDGQLQSAKAELEKLRKEVFRATESMLAETTLAHYIYIYIYMFHLKGVIVIVTVTVTVIVITIVKVILAIIVIIIMIIMIVVIVASPLAETYVCRFTLTGCAGMLVQVHRLHHSESTASFLVALSKWRSPCTRTNIPAQPVRVNLQT